MIKYIYSFLMLFVFCSHGIAGDLELYFLSRGLDKSDDKHVALIQSINISAVLQGSDEISKAKIIRHWRDEVTAESIIHGDPTCAYLPDHSIFYYMYIKDTEEDDRRTVKIFDLDQPSFSKTVPKLYYLKTLGRFYLPQFDFQKHPNRLFVLFMNYDVDLMKVQAELDRGEITYAERREIQKKAQLLRPTLKSYHIGSLKEKIEPDLNIMTTMGEGLSVFLSPEGKINYLGYGLIHDSIKLPYTMPDDIFLKLNITDQPDDNVWIVLRNRRNHLILAGQGKTLLYLKETDQWKLYTTPVKYKLIESNNYLVFNFIGTYGKDRFGDDFEIYERRKLCVNLKNGDSHFMDTEIDSRIVYFDGEMKIILNETGFEVSKRDELLKFIYYPQAEYIEEVMFKVTK